MKILFHTMEQRMTREDERIAENLEKIKHKIVIMSGKGGVGKSTVAATLAYALSLEENQVGLLDVDIHGPNIPKMLNIENEKVTGNEQGIQPIRISPHLKVMSMAFFLSSRDSPILWKGPLKIRAIKQFLGGVEWGNLDYLIVDLPPGTGDEPLSIAQFIPDGKAVIVTTPQDVALLDSRKAVMFAKIIHMPVIGIVENMSDFMCPHCGKEIALFKTGGGKRTSMELGVPFLGSIPIDEKIVESGDKGIPFILGHKKSNAAKAFMEITKNIEKAMKHTELLVGNDNHHYCHERRLCMGKMKGIYILILKVKKDMVVEIGKIGLLPFKKGYYAYVGSAMNGLEARIKRHLRKEKKMHWHIDFFLDKAEIKEIWYKEESEECEMAHVLSSYHLIKNFGCSDCACKSHLFYSPSYKKLVNEIKKMRMQKY